MAPYYDYDYDYDYGPGMGLACAGGTTPRVVSVIGDLVGAWPKAWSVAAVITRLTRCVCMHACICVGSRTAEMSGPTHRHR